jgi:hypothetical protein
LSASHFTFWNRQFDFCPWIPRSPKKLCPAEAPESLLEIEPDPHAARRIDLQLSVVVDVAKLFRRRVVEYKNDRRQAARQIQLLVEHIRHVHRAVAAIVEELEILSVLPPLTRVIAVVIGDQVILEHHDSTHLVRDPVGVWSPCRRLIGGGVSRSIAS